MEGMCRIVQHGCRIVQHGTAALSGVSGRAVCLLVLLSPIRVGRDKEKRAQKYSDGKCCIISPSSNGVVTMTTVSYTLPDCFLFFLCSQLPSSLLTISHKKVWTYSWTAQCHNVIVKDLFVPILHSVDYNSWWCDRRICDITRILFCAGFI